MKNTKEVQAVLTSIYCINFTSKRIDSDITKIIDYAFKRFFGGNTNLLTLACIGKTKEQIMPEIMQVLESETLYKQYLDEYKERK